MDRLASLGWLNVIQSPLLDQEFMYSVLNSLGIPIYATDYACPACMKGSERFADHHILSLVYGSYGEGT